nr:hypothetical protein [Tanacetum cinerariifolium]
MVEVKVLMELAEENNVVSKEGARNGEWVKISMRKCIREQIPSQKKRILEVDQLTEDLSSSGQKDLVFVKSSTNDIKVSIPGVERPWLSEAEGFILSNHDTGRILPVESQRNITDPLVVVTNSSAADYDSTDESLVCSTPLPLLKKLDGAKPISGPKTIKLILRLCGSYGHDTNGHNKIISLEREINPRNPQHAFKRCEVCGSSTHTTTEHCDIEWFKRGEALQAKKDEDLKSTRAESSNANISKTPLK